MHSVLIYNVSELKSILTYETVTLLTQLYKKPTERYLLPLVDRYGNGVPELVEYWFRTRLQDICLVLFETLPPKNVPVEIINGFNTLPSILDQMLFTQVKIPFPLVEQSAQVRLSRFDLYLYYL